jgi:hypothetical protein
MAQNFDGLGDTGNGYGPSMQGRENGPAAREPQMEVRAGYEFNA